MKWWAVAAVALAACASPQAEQALRAQTALVGMSKGDLLACAGVPERTAASGGVEYLTYSREETTVERDVSWEPDPWTGGAFMRPDVMEYWDTDRCIATITVRDGRVSEVRYDEQRDILLCYGIVGACMGPAQ